MDASFPRRYHGAHPDLPKPFMNVSTRDLYGNFDGDFDHYLFEGNIFTPFPRICQRYPPPTRARTRHVAGADLAPMPIR